MQNKTTADKKHKKQDHSQNEESEDNESELNDESDGDENGDYDSTQDADGSDDNGGLSQREAGNKGHQDAGHGNAAAAVVMTTVAAAMAFGKKRKKTFDFKANVQQAAAQNLSYGYGEGDDYDNEDDPDADDTNDEGDAGFEENGDDADEEEARTLKGETEGGPGAAALSSQRGPATTGTGSRSNGTAPAPSQAMGSSGTSGSRGPGKSGSTTDESRSVPVGSSGSWGTQGTAGSGGQGAAGSGGQRAAGSGGQGSQSGTNSYGSANSSTGLGNQLGAVSASGSSNTTGRGHGPSGAGGSGPGSNSVPGGRFGAGSSGLGLNKGWEGSRQPAGVAPLYTPSGYSPHGAFSSSAAGPYPPQTGSNGSRPSHNHSLNHTGASSDPSAKNAPANGRSLDGSKGQFDRLPGMVARGLLHGDSVDRGQLGSTASNARDSLPGSGQADGGHKGHWGREGPGGREGPARRGLEASSTERSRNSLAGHYNIPVAPNSVNRAGGFGTNAGNGTGSGLGRSEPRPPQLGGEGPAAASGSWRTGAGTVGSTARPPPPTSITVVKPPTARGSSHGNDLTEDTGDANHGDSYEDSEEDSGDAETAVASNDGTAVAKETGGSEVRKGGFRKRKVAPAPSVVSDFDDYKVMGQMKLQAAKWVRKAKGGGEEEASPGDKLAMLTGLAMQNRGKDDQGLDF